MAELAARLENVSKRYRLGARSLRELLPNPLDWLRQRDGNGKGGEYIWALEDVSFNIQQGDSLGVIGPNGAGKSTLLKLLARVTAPTRGRAEVWGRVCPLIEVGAGFHPDLTGRENIFLNGSILGLSRREIQRKFDTIVDFSGLHDFIDTPVKRYSSGMYLRLGFAISTQVEPDLLLVDEVLAVGDAAFRARCMSRIRELRSSGTTILLVSHHLDTIRRVCNRCLVLQEGKIAFEGEPYAAVDHYLRRCVKLTTGERIGTGEMQIVNVSFLDGEGRSIKEAVSGEPLVVALDYEAHKPISHPVFSVGFYGSEGELVGGCRSNWENLDLGEISGSGRIEVGFPSLALLPGCFAVSVSVWDDSVTVPYDWHQQGYRLTVGGNRVGLGSTFLAPRWSRPETAATTAVGGGSSVAP